MASSTSTLAYDIIARDRASSTFSKIGRAAGALGIGLGAAGLVQFAKDSVNVEATFSSTMASIQVNAGIGEKALGSLSDLAVQLGQDTVFSANEAAAAMLALSKGGMTAAQIQAGALKSALNLAATEGIALEDSATIVARTLKTFGLNAGDAGKAVDMLAGGSLASTAGVQDLADALKYVGTTAKSSGYGLSDTVTALAALTDSGIDSTTAGSSLNRMLLGLTLGTTKASKTADDLSLSFTDAKGNLLPMIDVVQRLRDTFDGMSTSQRNNDLKKLFGVEGMRAANVLIEQGVAGWKKYKGAVDESGQAQKMADARMSGTKGSLERLSGSVETAQLALGKALAPAVQAVADGLSDNLGPAMDGAIDLGGDLVSAIEPLADILKMAGTAAGDAASLFNDLPGPVKTLAIQAGLAALVLPRLAGGVGLATSAMKNGYTYARVYGLELADTATRGAAVTTGLGKLAGAARQAAGIGGMMALADGAQQSNKALGALEQIAGGAALGFSMSGGPWGALIGGVGGGLIAALGSTADATDKTKAAFKDARPAAADYASTLDQVTGATTRSTRAMIYNQLYESGAIKQGNELGITARTLTDYMMGNADAQEQVNRKLEKGSKAAAYYFDANGGLVEVYDTHTRSSRELAKTLGIEQDELKKDTKTIRDKAGAILTLTEIAKGVPKKVVTDIKENAPAAQADIVKLIKQYDLTPKQVQTVLKQLGVDESIRDIKRLIAQQNALHDKTVTISYQYRGLQGPGGSGPTRGRPDDTTGGSDPAGGAAPKTKTGGSSGRYSTGRGGGRPLSKGDLDGAEIRVVGVDPGAKAYFYTGGSSRY